MSTRCQTVEYTTLTRRRRRPHGTDPRMCRYSLTLHSRVHTPYDLSLSLSVSSLSYMYIDLCACTCILYIYMFLNER